jgi:hypothetical protein
MWILDYCLFIMVSVASAGTKEQCVEFKVTGYSEFESNYARLPSSIQCPHKVENARNPQQTHARPDQIRACLP